MVWLEGTGPAALLIVFLIRSFLLQSKKQLRGEKRQQKKTSWASGNNFYFLQDKVKSLYIVYNERNEIVFSVVTAEMNNLVEMKTTYK